MTNLWSLWKITLTTVLLLLICTPSSAQSVIRGPYLQEMSDSFVTVRWRTDLPTNATVRYGMSPDALNLSSSNGLNGVDHEIKLTGLDPMTTYYYSVGTDTVALAGDASYRFKTAPMLGQSETTRIWVVGDSGTANSNAIAVRDAFYQYTNNEFADMWLMLGDNAYPSGTDEEYQNAVFNMYPQLLRQMPLWSTLGNHDGVSADSSTQTGPYYDMFTLPDAGQLGGVASGTEAYYSFERGNIHFVVLNSFDVDRSPQSPMMTWLQADVAASTKEWLIAMWHHPPYSHGSHNSDLEGELIDMRQNALPILEEYGVDLIMSGHSHAYERTFLIDSHYGTSDTLGPVHMIDSGDGRPQGDGAYNKPMTIAAAHEGAVYAVAGSSGVTGGGLLDHPAMVVSLNTLGSMVLTIDDMRLDAVFLDSTAQIQDSFSIIKNSNGDVNPPRILDGFAVSSEQVKIQFSEPMNTTSLESIANYTFDYGVSVINAEASTVENSVMLIVTPLVQQLNYEITIDNVSDLSGNVIAADSSITVQYAHSTTHTFSQGTLPNTDYDGAQDTYLSEGQPLLNFSNALTLQVDGDDGLNNDLSALLYWDVSSIAAGTQVDSVILVLDVFDPSGQEYEVYSLTRAWDPGSVTWNESETGVSWEVPGANGPTDRGSTVLGSLFQSVPAQSNVVLNEQGRALVQEWIDSPSSNNGLLLGDTNNSDGIDFHSSESNTATQRPRLVIVSDTPLLIDTDEDGVIDTDDNCPLNENSLQVDSDIDGFGNVCDADFNNDCTINFLDFAGLSGAFLSDVQLYDLNEDGVVNFIDIQRFSAVFQQKPGPSPFVSCP